MSLLGDARVRFINDLLRGVVTESELGIASFADAGSDASKRISKGLLQTLGAKTKCDKMAGQVSGATFEKCVADFIKDTFCKLGNLRPGLWVVEQGGGGIDRYHQFRALRSLRALRAKKPLMKDPVLRDIAMADQYTIKPDIVVYRRPELDNSINATIAVVDQGVARYAPFRAENQADEVMGILHACVSCKFTIRSDRVQNVRAEALSLIRHRRGHLPHIAVVTCEPLPSRLASIARGTGEVDCVYHAFLPELLAAVRSEVGQSHSEQLEDLEFLVQGGRIRDIADLPLDLAT
jgi:hypothetical protein